ncbi:MAG: hypothetical protein K5849_00235, partial [Bacteroidales bacterium]|nr:hypothetical protein [Bacteroidales bacterium]
LTRGGGDAHTKNFSNTVPGKSLPPNTQQKHRPPKKAPAFLDIALSQAITGHGNQPLQLSVMSTTNPDGGTNKTPTTILFPRGGGDGAQNLKTDRYPQKHRSTQFYWTPLAENNGFQAKTGRGIH